MREHLNSLFEPGQPRMTTRVAGLALAAGAVSLGLVVIGACDVRPHDVYVAPPPLSTNLPTTDGTRAPTSTTQVVYIPPTPSWHVAKITTPHPSVLPSLPSYTYNPAEPYASLTPSSGQNTSSNPSPTQSDSPPYTTDPGYTDEPGDTTTARAPYRQHRTPSE
ncbi:hypothetical protein [Nocardia alni]|uniref:hypothetical protein n=1 Tax=Nocardia alni TaxID=2815723 RepID=UPI001C24B7AD|nr:hypothetical protein [Nocardia alni]